MKKWEIFLFDPSLSPCTANIVPIVCLECHSRFDGFEHSRKCVFLLSGLKCTVRNEMKCRIRIRYSSAFLIMKKSPRYQESLKCYDFYLASQSIFPLLWVWRSICRKLSRPTYSRSTLLWRGFIHEEISRWYVNKSGNSSLHLSAKGGLVPASVHN